MTTQYEKFWPGLPSDWHPGRQIGPSPEERKEILKRLYEESKKQKAKQRKPHRTPKDSSNQ